MVFFQSSDEEGEVRKPGLLERSSSSDQDEEILDTNNYTGLGRLAMKSIGRKSAAFKMEVVDD